MELERSILMSIYRIWFICMDMRIALTSWPSSRHCFSLALSECWEMMLFASKTQCITRTSAYVTLPAHFVISCQMWNSNRVLRKGSTGNLSRIHIMLETYPTSVCWWVWSGKKYMRMLNSFLFISVFCWRQKENVLEIEKGFIRW